MLDGCYTGCAPFLQLLLQPRSLEWQYESKYWVHFSCLIPTRWQKENLIWIVSGATYCITWRVDSWSQSNKCNSISESIMKVILSLIWSILLCWLFLHPTDKLFFITLNIELTSVSVLHYNAELEWFVPYNFQFQTFTSHLLQTFVLYIFLGSHRLGKRCAHPVFLIQGHQRVAPYPVDNSCI